MPKPAQRSTAILKAAKQKSMIPFIWGYDTLYLGV
jgi:hypothetical protein